MSKERLLYVKIGVVLTFVIFILALIRIDNVCKNHSVKIVHLTNEEIYISDGVPDEETNLEATTDESTFVEEVVSLSEREKQLIALITMAEAEAECDLGQRMVIDTILNRVDHERFPDTIDEVIFQTGQFTSTTNGRMNRCYVREDILQKVEEELLNRTNNDVLFFRASHFSSYGTPLFQIGGHYFSTLKEG